MKQQLVKVAQSGSSSNFVQAYSIIEIKDPKRLAEIEKIAGAPHYITQTGVFYLFVADLYKHHQLLQQANLPSDGLSNMEALLVAVVDTTIAAQNMAAFAETKVWESVTLAESGMTCSVSLNSRSCPVYTAIVWVDYRLSRNEK